MPEVIAAVGVGVRLGNVPVVRDVSFTVSDAEAVALMGENGSGKSTLVRSLVGILPASGSIRLFGAELTAHGGSVPWPRIGYVPQRAGVTAGVPTSAVEVVASGMLSRGRLRLPRDARRRARAALEQIGLADQASRSLRELSGGQQQRVLIARALVREPDLLVLDEPVAGVDHESQVAFSQILTELVSRRVTVLIVLHELGKLAPLLTRALVLRQGSLVHDGPPLRPEAGHEAPDHVHLHGPGPAPAATPLGDPIVGSR